MEMMMHIWKGRVEKNHAPPHPRIPPRTPAGGHLSRWYHLASFWRDLPPLSLALRASDLARASATSCACSVCRCAMCGGSAGARCIAWSEAKSATDKASCVEAVTRELFGEGELTLQPAGADDAFIASFAPQDGTESRTPRVSRLRLGTHALLDRELAVK